MAYRQRDVKILYAGDSPVGGSANYLLAVLRRIGASVSHIPPSGRLTARLVRDHYDALILSDFPCRHAPMAAQQAIAKHVTHGGGLLMVGGWGSFSGPLGGWRGSVVERLLPVMCQERDDRINFPGGAVVVETCRHPALSGVAFESPPVICGVNAVRPRNGSHVLLSAKRILWRSNRGPQSLQARLDPVGYPLLVVGPEGQGRTAALMTDLAPHWCGGLVDWGRTRRVLPVTGLMRVEVGDRYVRLIAALVRWLTGVRSQRVES